jgi:pimeloyl-ACP methyl ester carboxylesterase
MGQYRAGGAIVGEYVAIRGHPTWVDLTGEGTPVLVLHGGFSNSDGLLGVFAGLAEEYRLIAFDRRGHGRTADSDAPFHYDDMALETIAVLDHVGGEAAHLVGFSDGGIVALLVALARPDLVRSLVLIGVNYHFDGLVPGVFDDVGPDSELVTFTSPGYAERSPDGADHFPVVVAKAAAMLTSEPTLTPNDLACITIPALVLTGDDDITSPIHTWSLYESLPNSQLAVVPGASHTVPYEKPELVAQLVSHFLRSGGEVSTMMPIRRAHEPSEHARSDDTPGS